MNGDSLIDTIKPNQIIDYYLQEEVKGGWQTGFATRVHGKISQHKNLIISKDKIYARATKIRKGEDYLRPASDFTNQPSPREGKDRAYEGFWALMDILIPSPENRHYIGLAANQIDSVRNRVQNNITVVENNRAKAANLKLLADSLNTSGYKVDIKSTNVFRVLKSKGAESQYNIFDLDLMCIMPKKQQSEIWAKAIYNAAKPGANILHFAVCVGRSISIDEHDSRAIYLHDALVKVGFGDIVHSHFSYRDRFIPMRGERIVMTKNPRKFNF